MNFLVTGGAGFIGSHVCERLLREGHCVWAFDDLNNFYDPRIKQQNLREIGSAAIFNFSMATSRMSARSANFFPPRNLIRSSISPRARASVRAWNNQRFTSA